MIRTDVRDVEQDRSVPGGLGEARKQGVQALGSAEPETALARIAASRICGPLRGGACHRNLSSSGPCGPRRPGYPCCVSMSSVFASVSLPPSLPPSVPFLYICICMCVCVLVCVISEENL